MFYEMMFLTNCVIQPVGYEKFHEENRDTMSDVFFFCDRKCVLLPQGQSQSYGDYAEFSIK